MIAPIAVRALADYRLYIKFSDGAEGVVDLSDLAGCGVFAAWADYSFFERVSIGSHREIKWSDEIDICPDALYCRVTGKTLEELARQPSPEKIHA